MSVSGSFPHDETSDFVTSFLCFQDKKINKYLICILISTAKWSRHQIDSPASLWDNSLPVYNLILIMVCVSNKIEDLFCFASTVFSIKRQNIPLTGYFSQIYDDGLKHGLVSLTPVFFQSLSLRTWISR